MGYGGGREGGWVVCTLRVPACLCRGAGVGGNSLNAKDLDCLLYVWEVDL